MRQVYARGSIGKFIGRALLALGLFGLVSSKAMSADLIEGVARYDTIIMLVMENNGLRIFGNGPFAQAAPYINSLAKKYGYASNFYGENHPGSEANYVAMLAGTTNGFHDSNPYYCKPLDADVFCTGAATPGYHDHTYYGPNLVTQLEAAGISWKTYQEGMPTDVRQFLTTTPTTGPMSLYVTRHNGFLNMKSVQDKTDAELKTKLLGYDQLALDLAQSENFPRFSMIVPNVCNDMHGVNSTASIASISPTDCYINTDPMGLVRRGDNQVKDIITAIQNSKVWKTTKNVAIVLTWDESDNMQDFSGCCGNDPADPTNSGGGPIVTVIISNYGVRGFTDPTPYNHYSLMRTIENAFGISEHLNLAGATDKGVKAMAPLFRVCAPPGCPTGK